jgi:hypothetical protein
MSIDWSSLLKRTSLDNPDCISKHLGLMGIINQRRLQNLPRIHGKPWFCENSVFEVVQQLNKAVHEESQSIPIIDQIEVPEPAENASESPVTQETYLAELDLPGVSEKQINKLAKEGLKTVGSVLKNEGKHIEDLPGFGEATKERVVSAVKAALDKS